MTKIRGGSVKSVQRLKKSLKSSGRRSSTVNIGEEGLTVRFLTEPEEWFEFFEHYDDTRSGSYFFPCTEGCYFCAENPDARTSKRYLVSAVDTEESRSIALKLPLSAASSLMKKYDRYQTLMDRDYFLSREGTGLDTEYDVTPEPPSKFNASKYDQIDPEEILQGLLGEGDDDDVDDDDEDDEDEEAPPVKKRPAKKQRPMKKRRK